MNFRRNVQFSEYCSTIWCADAAGVARADANVSGLQFAMRIPMQNLGYFGDGEFYVADMCALSADEVLLACDFACHEALHAVSLHNAQLVAHELIDRAYGAYVYTLSRNNCRIQF